MADILKLHEATPEEIIEDLKQKLAERDEELEAIKTTLENVQKQNFANADKAARLGYKEERSEKAIDRYRGFIKHLVEKLLTRLHSQAAEITKLQNSNEGLHEQIAQYASRITELTLTVDSKGDDVNSLSDKLAKRRLQKRRFALGFVLSMIANVILVLVLIQGRVG